MNYVRKEFAVYVLQGPLMENMIEQKNYITLYLSPSLFLNISFSEYHSNSGYFSPSYLEGLYTLSPA